MTINQVLLANIAGEDEVRFEEDAEKIAHDKFFEEEAEKVKEVIKKKR